MIKVYKIKDILKYLIGIICFIIILIFLVNKITSSIQEKDENKIYTYDISAQIDELDIPTKAQNFSISALQYCLNTQIPTMSYLSDATQNQQTSSSQYQVTSRSAVLRFLDTELGMISTLEDYDEDLIPDQNFAKAPVGSGINDTPLQQPKTGLLTEVTDVSRY